MNSDDWVYVAPASCSERSDPHLLKVTAGMPRAATSQSQHLLT